jgi:hypothetical protein
MLTVAVIYNKTLVMKTKYTAAFLVVLVSFLGVVSSHADDVLDNKSIIALHQLGLGETVIINKIKTSRCNFDTSLDGLKQIKADNISDSVISAMIMAPSQGAAPAASAPAAPVAASAPSGDPNDPTAMHEPGIWLYQENGDKKMTKLEPSVITKMESGGGAIWGMAWGATAKSRADLNGAAAAVQINRRKPVFYFYFDPSNQSGAAATSPTEFVLAQMEVRKKDDERRMVVGQMNAYSGSKTGPDQKDVRKITFDRLASGIYKVSPQDDLADGEYAFYYAGSAPVVGYYFVMGAGGKLFDFGIKASP